MGRTHTTTLAIVFGVVASAVAVAIAVIFDAPTSTTLLSFVVFLAVALAIYFASARSAADPRRGRASSKDPRVSRS